MRTFFGLAGILLVIALLIFLVTGFSLGFRFVTAELRGIVGMEERVQSAPFRQSAYEKFYNLCATVQGHEATLEAQKSILKEAEGDDKSRIRSNIAGIEAQRARSIAQYNADARKEATVGQFRDAGLPSKLDKDEETTCSNN